MNQYFTTFFLLHTLLFGVHSICGVTIVGRGELTSGTFDKLQVNGSTHLTQVTVTGSAKVNGRCHASELTVGEGVRVNGNADLEHVRVAGDTYVNGRCNAEDLDVQGDFTVNGGCSVEKSTLHGDASFSGRCTAKEVQFLKNVRVRGVSLVERCVVKGDFELLGKGEITDCKLQKITATAIEVELKDTSTTHIAIHQSNNYSFFSWLFSWLIEPEVEQQFLYLRGKTQVDGDITFTTKKPGIIHKSPQAIITGTVVNGLVQED